jgi:hypothetical protein
MTHGGAGTYDINLPLSGAPGIECRSGSTPGSYTIVFTFNNPISSVNSVASDCGSASGAVDGGNPQNYVVQLTGVTCNEQYVTVTLTGVNDIYAQTLSSASAVMGLLIGDTTGNGFVNSSDISQTQAESGNLASASNFREDVAVNGTINSTDIQVVQANSGTSLGPPPPVPATSATPAPKSSPGLKQKPRKPAVRSNR